MCMKLAARLNWQSSTSSLLLGLAVMALSFRLLVPPGYMPSFGGANNFIALEFCSIHAERQTVFIDLETGERLSQEDADGAPSEQDGQDSAQPCAFASGMSATALAPGATPDLAQIRLPEENPRPETTSPITSAIAHLPWATGPPMAAM